MHAHTCVCARARKQACAKGRLGESGTLEHDVERPCCAVPQPQLYTTTSNISAFSLSLSSSIIVIVVVVVVVIIDIHHLSFSRHQSSSIIHHQFEPPTQPPTQPCRCSIRPEIIERLKAAVSAHVMPKHIDLRCLTRKRSSGHLLQRLMRSLCSACRTTQQLGRCRRLPPMSADACVRVRIGVHVRVRVVVGRCGVSSW